VIYLQQQPYRYTKSYSALEKFLDMPTVQGLQGYNEIRQWYQSLVLRIPSTAMRDIEANCGYSSFAKQVVVIDSNEYILHDPATQYASCGTNTAFVGGLNRGFYISGNLQIMGIGIFSARSSSRIPGYVHDMSTSETVVGNIPQPIKPSLDHKVVKVCMAPWNKECVYADGFAGEPGSSFHWTGVQRDGITAFAVNSSVTMISDKPAAASKLHPCYVYNADTDSVQSYDSSYTVSQTKRGLSGCKKTWVVPAREVRNSCHEDLVAPTAHMSFRAAKGGLKSVMDLYNITFLCSTLMERSAVELQNVYFVSTFPTSNQMDVGIPYNGAVVTAPNEHTFAVVSWDHLTKLNFYRVFDGNTKMIRVFSIMRNYGSREMFYALVSLTFNVDSSGYTTSKLEVAFVPMMKYFYAMDGNEWMFREVLVLEIFLGFFGLLFVVKTIVCVWKYAVANFGFQKGRSIRHRKRFKATRGGHEVDSGKGWKKASDVAPVPQEESADADAAGTVVIDRAEAGDVDRSAQSPSTSTRQDLRAVVPVSHSPSAPVSLTGVEEAKNAAPPAPTDRTVTFFLCLDIATVVVLIMFLVTRVRFVKACIFIANQLTSGKPTEFREMEMAYNDINNTSADVTSVAYAFIVVSICQFFRYMSFDPRMGIVIDTIHDSIEYLGPILMVFVGVLVAFAALGSQMFGSRHFGWSTFGRSILSLMMMILGDHDQFYAGEQ
jgi:hypothetical protein